ncbi:MAG: 3-keto-disaccharide hydrolase [Bryobacteraceae bacterium]
MAIAAFTCMLLALQSLPAGWTPLFNGKTLDGWEVIGEGVWTVMSDGTLLGQCDPRKPCLHQSWLYTKKDFGEFDLYLEFWTRLGGNSGVSIRDTSRARWAVGTEWNSERTPSHIGYEIQISNGYPDRYPTGSIYLLAPARDPDMRNDWNTLEIESRLDRIRVKLNGKLVAEHPGLPDRPKTGPIGLQLHDRNSIVLFRNIRIREITPASAIRN